MSPIRVLVVDDHPHFITGLRALLDTAEVIEVVGAARSGSEGLALASRVQPDVVLMDLTMPGMGGVEATRQLTLSSPHIAVLVLSMVEDDDSVFAALQAGARGYLLKGARKTELVRAIQAVAGGEAIFGPAVATRLVNYFAKPKPVGSAEFPQLTTREVEILRLIAQHVTNPEIAARLGLTPKTVRNHVSNIFAKLRVADRAQAIMAAREAGLR